MAEILTKTGLDKLAEAGCAQCGRNGGDEPIYFHSHCHPESPVWASYLNGILRVECAECKKLITAIRIQGGEAV